MDTLVIGIGNRYRSDDGAGPAVLDLLRAKQLPGVRLLECDGDGAALLDVWQVADAVFLIDAVSSNAPPGTIYRFDLLAQQLPREVAFQSTHAFGVAEAVELGRVLGQLPDSLVLYAIEGKSFAAGVGLSTEILAAVQEVARQVESTELTERR
jgi:hydrogenase maturation protease